MIPKKIHYIWVGGKEKPENIKRCLATWKEKLKDYEIIEWNESNFDISSHPYTKAAYEAKKWAFVSDYIRAYALDKEGGIYLDTDVLVLEEFGDALENQAFIGFENPNYISAAIIGAQKEHPFIKSILNYYDTLDSASFNFNDNNSISVSKILTDQFGAKMGNEEQILKDGIHIYPDGVFSNPSKDSRTIHLFTGTWLEQKPGIKKKICDFLKIRLTTKKRAILYNKFFRS